MGSFKAILLLMIFAACAQAQDTARIKRSAELLITSTIQQDLKTLASLTYAPVIQAMGGTDKMIATLTKGMADMKSSGAAITGGSIGTPGKVLHIGTKLYSVVPETVLIVSNGTKLSSNSSLLAISLNKGISWYFVEAGNMSDAVVKQLFPDVAGKLVIPKRTEPTVIN